MKNLVPLVLAVLLLAPVFFIGQTLAPSPFTGGGIAGSGTVTSFSGSGPSWLTWSVATPTTTPAVTLAPTTGQTSHQVIGTCGTATTFTPCVLVIGDLPATVVTSAAGLTNTALMTGAGGQASQTPNASATLSAGGAISLPSTLSTGVGSGTAGAIDMTAGTSAAVGSNVFGWGAPATMTTSVRLESPNAVPVAHSAMILGAPVSNKATWTYQAINDCTGSFKALTFSQSGPDTFGCNTIFATVFGSGTITVPAGNSVIVGCTSTCSVPVPVPMAGYQICIKNLAGVTTVITLSALGSSAAYPKADDSGYGTAGTGTMVSSAATNKVCLIGRDATHYELGAINAAANWTVN